MRPIYLAIALIAACGSNPVAPTAPVPPPADAPVPAPVAEAELSTEPVVAFASEASMQRLSRSQHRIDFFKLSNQFESQQNLAMCGPTTAVIVLNTLRPERSDRPTNSALFPEKFAKGLPPGLEPVFRRYSQGVFFDDERVTKVKKEETFYGTPNDQGKRDGGMQLRQLHQILKAQGLESQIRVVSDDMSVDTVREELRANLSSADDYVIINYHRPVLDQKGGGHISPLGAYDQRSDSFLILDVNPNGKTWVWVQAEALVAAMRTKDTLENRGYLLVSEASGG